MEKTPSEKDDGVVTTLAVTTKIDSETLSQLEESRAKFQETTADNFSDLPEMVNPALRDIIGNRSEPFEDKLTKTDATGPSLWVSKKRVLSKVMPLLRDNEDPRDEGIPVTVYDSDGIEYPMNFDECYASIYSLSQGWVQYREARNLNVADVVRIWMFRHVATDKLCFLIIPLKDIRSPNPVEKMKQTMQS